MTEQRPTCETCRFWSAGEIAVVGECRRHAPSPVVRFAPPDSGNSATVDSGSGPADFAPPAFAPPDFAPTASAPTVRWPAVRSEDWCGEHRTLAQPAAPTASPNGPAASATSPAESVPSPSPPRAPASTGATARPSAAAKPKASRDHAPGRDHEAGRDPRAAAPRQDTTRSSSLISGLSARTKKVVALLGVSTWEQLAELTAVHVRGQKGTGVGTISELREGLQARGLAFADEQGN